MDDLVSVLLALSGRTPLVAIDGPGGAGKTTYSELLSEALDAVPVVHTDDFASADNPIDWWPRLLEQVIEPLAAGEPAIYQRYDWPSEQLAEWHSIEPGQLVLIEGVSAGRSEWTRHLSYLIWIDTPRELRLERGLQRDGIAARNDWEFWMASEDKHFVRDATRERADLIVDGTAPLAN